MAEEKSEESEVDIKRRRAILEGPIVKTLLGLAWPMILTTQLNNILGLILLFWVARLGGGEGLESFMVMGPIFSLVSLLFSDSISDGCGTLVAQSVGANDGRGRAILKSALQLFAMVGVPLILVGAAFSVPIVDFISGDTVSSDVLLPFFLGWLLFAFPMTLLGDLIMAAIVSSGWTGFGVVRVVVEMIVMFTLVPIFMSWLGFGMLGPPLAGGIAAGGLAVLTWRALNKHGPRLGLGGDPGPLLKIDRSTWRRMIEIGLPPQLGRMAIWGSQVIYTQALVRSGEGWVAGYGLTLQLLFLIPGSVGMCVAGSSGLMIGQNMGAGQSGRAIKALIRASFVIAAMLALFLVFTLFSRPVFELLSDDPTVVDPAMEVLSILRWGWIGMSIYQLLNSAFMAVGATKLASSAVIACEGVGLLFLFLYPGRTVEAVAYAFTLATGLRALCMLLLVKNSLLRPLLAATKEPAAV